jgi:heme exporter protein C
MLRNGIENAEQRRRFASIYGILAIVTVIVTLVIIRIEPRTIHPAVIGPSPQNAQGSIEMTASMITALGVNSAIWSILVPATFIWHRIRLQNRIEAVEAQKAEVLNT